MNKTKNLAYLSVLLAIAFILSWVETIIPPLVPTIPGIKAGLANIIILFSVFNLKNSETFMILSARLILNVLFFGNAVSLIYSAAGGFLSFAAMVIIKKISSKEIPSSIGGGIFHNIGQLSAAYFVLDSTAVFSYLPYLIISGILSDALIGFITDKINKRINLDLFI